MNLSCVKETLSQFTVVRMKKRFFLRVSTSQSILDTTLKQQEELKRLPPISDFRTLSQQIKELEETEEVTETTAARKPSL